MSSEGTSVERDLKMVRKAIAGDQRVFRQLVEEHQASVAKVVIGMLGNGPDAEDAGQETFIRFFHAMKKYKGESSLRTYLTRIAINLSLNVLKKRKRQLSDVDQITDRMQLPADLNTTAHEDKDIIDKALAQLDEEHRSVVVIRLMEGYSTKETAEILDIPLGTVLSRLSRAQQKLRKMLTINTVYHE